MKAIIEFIINLLKAIFGGKTPPLDDPVPVPLPPVRPPINIEQKLDAMVKESGQKLNWRNSIVDLLKLLNLNSSTLSRQQLAQKLGYHGDMRNTDAMNSWLHGQVMARLVQNNGEVPAELRL